MKSYHWAMLDTVAIGALIVAGVAAFAWTIRNWSLVWPNLVLLTALVSAGYLTVQIFQWRLKRNGHKQ